MKKLVLSDQEKMGLQKTWSYLEKCYSKDFDTLIKYYNKPNKYKVKHRDHYTMVATGGDMSAGGMGECATQYRITPNQYGLVNHYIDFESLYNRYTRDAFTLGLVNDPQKMDQAVSDKFRDHDHHLIDMMRDRGPFESKYDFRSTWCLIEMPEYDHTEEVA